MTDASGSDKPSLVETAEKALAEKRFEDAVEFFSDACERYSIESGGNDDPELLFKYGNALFQLAKSQVGVLDQKQADERQLPVEHAHVQLAENMPAPGPDAGEKDENTSEKELAANDDEEEDEEDEADAEDAEEEEETDFKTAFKIVDWARVIWGKMDQTPETRQKLLNARNLLGEISDEDDNHLQATEDFEAALELTKELNSADSMAVCEAHWKAARAYANAEDIEKAAEHARKAAEIARLNKSELAEDLETRAEDLAKEAKSGSAPSDAAKQAAQDVAGRQASVARDVFSNLLGGAQDISSFTRKRKRDDKEQGSDQTKKKDTGKAKD